MCFFNIRMGSSVSTKKLLGYSKTVLPLDIEYGDPRKVVKPVGRAQIAPVPFPTLGWNVGHVCERCRETGVFSTSMECKPIAKCKICNKVHCNAHERYYHRQLLI